MKFIFLVLSNSNKSICFTFLTKEYLLINLFNFTQKSYDTIQNKIHFSNNQHIHEIQKQNIPFSGNAQMFIWDDTSWFAKEGKRAQSANPRSTLYHHR